LVCSERASSDALAHPSRPASSLSPISTFSPLVPSSVLDYLDSALVSAVLRTSITTHLGTSLGGVSAPCLSWAWEGIGTPAWI
jgi:hypothetical protein